MTPESQIVQRSSVKQQKKKMEHLLKIKKLTCSEAVLGTLTSVFTQAARSTHVIVKYASPCTSSTEKTMLTVGSFLWKLENLQLNTFDPQAFYGGVVVAWMLSGKEKLQRDTMITHNYPAFRFSSESN